jgi:cell shape-determining protein MreD
LAGLTQRSAFRAQLLLPVITVFVATMLYDLIFLLAMLISGRPVQWLATLGSIILPSAALNLLLTPIVYLPLRSLHRRVGREAMEW